MDKISLVKREIQNSKYLVCLQGIGTSLECGCKGYRDRNKAYEIEEKYGYSPEEMFNASFYNTRIEQFYDYFKSDMIGELGEVGPGIRALKEMEDKGYLQAIVTREQYHLAVRAGCKNVEELHGNLYHYFCPRCHKEYSIDYIKESKGVPLCEKCRVPVRPGVRLVGEMIDNSVLTRAASYVSRADVLLIVGCNMVDNLASMVKYFNGNKVILIHEREHYSDGRADIVIHGKPSEILPQITP